MKGRLTKRCTKCGWLQAHFPAWWDGLEWIDGRRRPARHVGCDGEFLTVTAKRGA